MLSCSSDRDETASETKISLEDDAEYDEDEGKYNLFNKLKNIFYKIMSNIGGSFTQIIPRHKLIMS